MRRLLALMAISLALACGSDDDSSSDSGRVDSAGMACAPGEPIACRGDDILLCSNGLAADVVACGITCDEETITCTCEADSMTCVDGFESTCGEDGHATIRKCETDCADAMSCS